MRTARSRRLAPRWPGSALVPPVLRGLGPPVVEPAVLAVAPGAAPAVLVPALLARVTDHDPSPPPDGPRRGGPRTGRGRGHALRARGLRRIRARHRGRVRPGTGAPAADRAAVRGGAPRPDRPRRAHAFRRAFSMPGRARRWQSGAGRPERAAGR